MADGSVAIDEPELVDTDKYLDTDEVTFGVAPLLRHRERVRLAGEAAADLTEVTAGELHVRDAAARSDLAAILAALGATLTVDVDNFPAGFAVVGAVEVTNDAGNPLPVSGTGLGAAVFSQIAVDGTEDAIPVLVGSKTIAVKALSTNTEAVFLGLTGVTTLTGWEMVAGDAIELDVSDGVPLFVITGGSAQRICVAKVA